ncbi:MAG: hypothetical protein ABJG78_13695 [Cyclobacteriaceae bacterium]
MITNKRYHVLKFYLVAGLLICFFSLSGYVHTVTSKLPVDQLELLDQRMVAGHHVSFWEGRSSTDVTTNRSVLDKVFHKYYWVATEYAEKVRILTAPTAQSRVRSLIFVQRKTIPTDSEEPAPTSLIG